MPDTGITALTLLQAGVARLQAAGIADPRREARRIWYDVVDGRGLSLLQERELRLDPADVTRFERAVRRREMGAPLPHATGLAGFRRLTLASDARALIPRPETEGLVELVLARMPVGRVVDVGTGSGCIALALADEGRYDLVVGIDQSADALALARENRERTQLGIALVHGDLASMIAPQSVDVVVSNPPYLTAAEYAGLDGSVRDWEPAAALASGADGLEATRRLASMALQVVRRNGWLALEVDAERAGVVAAILTVAGWQESAVYMDLFGRARYVLARKGEGA